MFNMFGRTIRRLGNKPAQSRFASASNACLVRVSRLGTVFQSPWPLSMTPSRPLSVDRDSHDDFKPRVKTPAPSPGSKETISDMLRKDVEGNEVFLYMKGYPDAPQCGFSRKVVNILQTVGADFKSRNVLEDMEVREEIKVFSDWPTFPQLYVRGEFVGGCDIVTNMYNSGELQDLLKNKM